MQVRGTLFCSQECLPFFLVMIGFGESAPYLALYSVRICILCFFPFTMTLSSTSSEGRHRPMSVFASSNATFNLSKGAFVMSVLRSVGRGAKALGTIDWYFFSTKFLCILSAICCSKEWVCLSLLGKIVGRLAPEQCLIGCDKGGKQS